MVPKQEAESLMSKLVTPLTPTGEFSKQSSVHLVVTHWLIGTDCFFDEPRDRLLWVGRIPGEVKEQVVQREESSDERRQVRRRQVVMRVSSNRIKLNRRESKKVDESQGHSIGGKYWTDKCTKILLVNLS